MRNESMKGLMKTSYGGSTIWRGWRGIGSPRESMLESVLVVVQLVCHGRDGNEGKVWQSCLVMCGTVR